MSGEDKGVKGTRKSTVQRRTGTVDAPFDPTSPQPVFDLKESRRSAAKAVSEETVEETPVEEPVPIDISSENIRPKLPELEPVPETPTAPVAEEFDMAQMKAILSVPKTKDSIPTLTCIDKKSFKRYFILDVDGEAYRKAWDYYCRTVTQSTPDDFILRVCSILDMDLPRMYRSVSYIPLQLR